MANQMQAVGKRQTAPPPLAHWRDMAQWMPAYGDYLVWAGYITQWHGIVTDYDPATDELSVIVAGLPFLLFTLTDVEQKKDTKKLTLSKVRGASKGNFAVMQHDTQQNASIWYV